MLLDSNRMSELRSDKRRLFLRGLDPLLDIDLSSVPDSVWELLVETAENDRSPKSMSILNIPFNLTSLSIGPRLSASITEPFHLPMSLLTYRGPVICGMKIPPHLENLHLVESTKSLQTSDVVMPNLTTLVVEGPLKFSNLDSTELPKTLQSFKIVGKYNCSLEKMSFPPTLKTVDLGLSTQPVDLLATRANIVRTEQAPQKKVNPSVVHVDSDTSVLTALREHLPKLDKLHVILDDKILTSLGDVWTEVLLEGRVQVRELTVTNTPTKTCLSDCAEVFNRSSLLGRRLCRSLKIVSENFSNATHLNLAIFARQVNGISLEISYTDSNGPSECFLTRFAHLMGLSKSGSKYVSDSFGAKPTTAHINPETKTFHLVLGDAPQRYETPKKLEPLIVPYSSSALQEVSNASKPKDRPITLYTWTKCGFCQKQAEVIEEYKHTSEENKNLFQDKVQVVTLENPQDVPDKRVDSFPTWVKDDNLVVGVQNAEMLTNLLAQP